MRPFRYLFYLVGKLLALAFIFIGGGLLATTVLPLLALFPGQNHIRAQYLIRMLFRFYLQTLQIMGLIRLEIVGIEKLAQCNRKIVIANHPSLLDVVILMAFIPKVQCIVKHQLWDHRSLGFLMRRAGYIRNNLAPEELVEQCRASLEEGRSLVIFPEGTRTSPGSDPHFQRGFANIATLTKTQIQLVVIDCHPPFLFKGEPMLHVPPIQPSYKIVVGECLDPKSYLLYGQRSIAARKLVESLEEYYAEQLRKGHAGIGA